MPLSKLRKENQKNTRPSTKWDVENLNPTEILFRIEATFLQAKSMNASEGKKFP